MCRMAWPAALDCMWLRLRLPTHIRIPAGSRMCVPGYVGSLGARPHFRPQRLFPPRPSIHSPSSPAQERASFTSRHKLPSHKHQPCLEADGPKSHLFTTANQFHRPGIACAWPQLQAPLQDCGSFRGTPKTAVRLSCLVAFGARPPKQLGDCHHSPQAPSPRWSLEREPEKMSGRLTSATKSVRGFCSTQTSRPCANPDPQPPQ